MEKKLSVVGIDIAKQVFYLVSMDLRMGITRTPVSASMLVNATATELVR